MRNFKTLQPNEWLNLINSEGHPDLDHFTTNYVKVGDMFAVHIMSGYGSFLSPMTKNSEEIDNLEAELKATYEKAKVGTQIRPLNFNGDSLPIMSF
jgi:hypothetical protein